MFSCFDIEKLIIHNSSSSLNGFAEMKDLGVNNEESLGQDPYSSKYTTESDEKIYQDVEGKEPELENKEWITEDLVNNEMNSGTSADNF